MARFICSERHVRKSDGRPRPGAFSPSPYKELSVAHTTGLAEAEVWEIGKKTLTPDPGRDKIYARADIPVQSLLDVRLRTLRDDKPYPRHTLVLDWPLGSDDDETKALQKQVCLDLSEDLRIKLAVPDAPITRS